ncbi:MAG: transaldolase family protein [bacterium]|nr:transaldolase family protein [bacterium]
MIQGTKVFLDSGSPTDTEKILQLMSLDGQTTNPSYVAKSPEVQTLLREKGKFSAAELLEYYKGIIQKIANLLPAGSVSIEVYADAGTSADDMLKQAREMNSWVPNAHIKLPTILEGLKAARLAIDEDIRVNMTLVFSQAQAAAVYSATRGAKKGQVFLSPFISRLDTIGENGLDLIRNIMKTYSQGDGHVEVLAASIHSTDVMRQLAEMGVDIMTVPAEDLERWASRDDDAHDVGSLKKIEFAELDLNQPMTSFDLLHPLTEQGLAKFAKDWKNLIRI